MANIHFCMSSLNARSIIHGIGQYTLCGKPKQDAPYTLNVAETECEECLGAIKFARLERRIDFYGKHSGGFLRDAVMEQDIVGKVRGDWYIAVRPKSLIEITRVLSDMVMIDHEDHKVLAVLVCTGKSLTKLVHWIKARDARNNLGHHWITPDDIRQDGELWTD